MLQSDDLPAGLASARWVRRVLLVVLFSIAFGYVEAALVVYLRGIYDPIRASLYPDKPADSLLPLMTLEQLREVDPVHIRRLGIELGREVATMIMLAALAVLAARHRGEGIAMFMIAFGAWDIAYYIGLKAMIDWPASLLAWDLLFLIPVPWLGPVLAPVIVAATMVAAGLVILAEVEHGRLPRHRDLAGPHLRRGAGHHRQLLQGRRPDHGWGDARAVFLDDLRRGGGHRADRLRARFEAGA